MAELGDRRLPRAGGCTSTEQHVRLLGDVAVLTHRVATRVRPAADEPEESLDERETIVLARSADGWLAVHEHLSPATP